MEYWRGWIFGVVCGLIMGMICCSIGVHVMNERYIKASDEELKAINAHLKEVQEQREWLKEQRKALEELRHE